MYLLSILVSIYVAFHITGMFFHLNSSRVEYHAFRAFGGLFGIYALIAWVM